MAVEPLPPEWTRLGKPLRLGSCRWITAASEDLMPKLKIIRQIQPREGSSRLLATYIEADVVPQVGWDIRDYEGRAFTAEKVTLCLGSPPMVVVMCRVERPAQIDVAREQKAGWSTEV